MDMEVDGTNSSNGSGPNQASKTTEEMDTEPASNTGNNQPKKKRTLPAIVRRENDEIPTELDGTDIICYTANDHLGQGATSTVYRGYYGKVRCAVKRVDSEYVEVYKNELAIWQSMKEKTENANVNIVTLFRWLEWEEGGGITYYFAMERALCDLEHRVKQLKKWRDAGDLQFPEQEKKLPRFLYEAAKGLMWVHNSLILHRDIKPENVLIFETSKGEIAKVGDFGISRKMSRFSGTNSAGKGTSDWMAPEALEAMNIGQNFKSTMCIDIFSLGMTSHYAISLGSHPFEYLSKFGIFKMTNIKELSVPPTTLEYPHFEADHLFQWMMQKEAQQRPKIIEVCNHPFFWSWERKKEFLIAVAICFGDKNDKFMVKLRKELDDNYDNVSKRLSCLASKNWKERLGKSLVDHLSKRKNSKVIKNYNGNSIMTLVELIRDKCMHSTEMLDELATSDLYFGKNGSFSRKKYVKFFLNTFPELVIFLFCTLARIKALVVLRNDFFADFNTVPPLLPVSFSKKVLREIFSNLTIGKFEDVKHSLLNCRLVHPRWKTMIDEILEEKCLSTWETVELSKKNCGDQQSYTFTKLKLQPESPCNLLCPPRIHEESRSTTSTPPFPSKSLVVKFAFPYGTSSLVSGKIIMKSIEFCEFFVQYGVHLTSLVLSGIKVSPKTLHGIFKTTSNLKALTLDSVSFKMDLLILPNDEEDKERDPYVTVNASAHSYLPPLEHLQHVRIFQTSVSKRVYGSRVGRLISSADFDNLYDWILKPYKSKLLTLDLDSESRVMNDFNFPVLKHLSIWEGREVNLNPAYMIVPQLEVLCLGAFCKGTEESNSITFSDIQAQLARFSGNLVELHLDLVRDQFQRSMLQCTPMDPWRTENVEFVNLKTFSILYPKFPDEVKVLKCMLRAMPKLETLNFLRFLDEGQEFINGDEEQAENQIEQERYWEVCPSLKKISVRIEVEKDSVFCTQHKAVTIKS